MIPKSGNNTELLAFIDSIVKIGSAYDIEGMKGLYTDDQAILFITADGGVARSPKMEFIAEFQSRRDAGEEPLSTEYRVLHLEDQGDHAVAVLYRRMSPKAAPAIYELRMRRENGRWFCDGETVAPWPDLTKAGSFLPPRERN
jgi:ketosteroid isomerase-like protein